MRKRPCTRNAAFPRAQSDPLIVLNAASGAFIIISWRIANKYALQSGYEPGAALLLVGDVTSMSPNQTSSSSSSHEKSLSYAGAWSLYLFLDNLLPPSVCCKRGYNTGLSFKEDQAWCRLSKHDEDEVNLVTFSASFYSHFCH